MSNNTKLVLKNEEGDPSIIIGLSIFAYVDFDALSKVIKASVDVKSAAATKKNLIEAVMAENKKFKIAKSYRKSIDIIADRDTDEHNTLTTKPISTQLENITVLQKALDANTVVDDIELSDSGKTSDDLVKAMYANMEKSDGDLFEAYVDAKKQKGVKDDTDGKSDSEAKQKDDAKPDPFEIPDLPDTEVDPLAKKTPPADSGTNPSDSKAETPGKEKEDLDDEDLSEVKEEEIIKRNEAIKKALPFSKFSIKEADSKIDFTKDDGSVKIVTDKDIKDGRKKNKKDAELEAADKDAAIKHALPFSNMNNTDVKASPDDKGPELKDDDKNEEVQIEGIK